MAGAREEVGGAEGTCGSRFWKTGNGERGTGNGKWGTDGDEWLVGEKPNITFDDIAGMEDAKRVIDEMVLYPMKSPEKARALGLNPGGGVLLFGPPGTGKTMLGKAIAGALDAPFYYASGADLRSKWYGESEQRLSQLLTAAKAQPVAVVFLDEIESLLPKRTEQSHAADNRVVTQFLSDLGGFKDSDNLLLVLGVTNKPWAIDEAVFRTGRFDEKVYIGPPDAAARHRIMELNLKSAAVAEDVDLTRLADKLEGYSGSDCAAVVSAATLVLTDDGTVRCQAWCPFSCLEASPENAMPMLVGSVMEKLFACSQVVGRVILDAEGPYLINAVNFVKREAADNKADTESVLKVCFSDSEYELVADADDWLVKRFGGDDVSTGFIRSMLSGVKRDVGGAFDDLHYTLVVKDGIACNVCMFPTEIPKDKLHQVAEAAMRLNQSLNCCLFTVDFENGRFWSRYSIPVSALRRSWQSK